MTKGTTPDMSASMPPGQIWDVVLIVFIALVIITLVCFIVYTIRRMLRVADQARSLLTRIEKNGSVLKSVLKPSFQTKINMLFENMNYAPRIKAYIEDNPQQFNAEVFLWDSKSILKFLQIRDLLGSGDWSSKAIGSEYYEQLQKFDVIALPYFALRESIKERYIISLENYASLFREGADEMQKFHIKSKNTQNIGLVLADAQHFGVPFTEISVVLGYNSFIFRENDVADDLVKLSKSKVRFGMLQNCEAGSQFYEFLNFAGYYGKEFFEFSDEATLRFESDRIVDGAFKMALRLYLTYYLNAHKHRGTWGSMLDELRLGTFDCCFVWTEQIKELQAFSYLDYKTIKLPYTNGYYQGDGWFVCLVRKKDGNYKPNLLSVINNLVGMDFQQELEKITLASPFIKIMGFETIAKSEPVRVGGAGTAPEIVRLLGRAKQKANIPKMSDFIRKFSRIIEERCAHKTIADLDSLLERVTEETKQSLEVFR